MTINVTHNATAVSILASGLCSLPVHTYMYLQSLTLTLTPPLGLEVMTLLPPRKFTQVQGPLY